MLDKKNYLFTSESVSEGHPDKICDQVSDAVLDAIFEQDPMSKVACECFATTGLIVVGGEISTKAYIDLQDLVRNVITDIGYTKSEYKFSAESCAVVNVINQQSPDIAMGVDTGGAGDQGMMFGYASKETPEYMPAPIMYSHKLMSTLADIRKNNKEMMPYLRPDAKAQVTFEYNDNHEIQRVDAIVISTQHDPEVSQDRITSDLKNYLIPEVLPAEYIDDDTKYYVNPTGNFVIGGPHGDAGLTGRKIIVDTYGGRAPHGGGAFSGKDPTKVDRSGAYAARHLAKNIVASGLADECTIQISYAIGVVEPVSIHVSTPNSSEQDRALEEFIRNNENMKLSPAGIIERLDLRRPIYRQTAAYGHFGKAGLPWEELNLVDEFKKF
jgi:S-adenosylmethionine synthetase